MSIRRGQRAFTLVELMIAVAIFGLIVPGSLLALDALTTTPAEETADLANINDVGYAAKWITRDANQAGTFWYHEENPSEAPWIFIGENHWVSYYYPVNDDGLVLDQLLRTEVSSDSETTFVVMRSVNDGDISFHYDTELSLLKATLKATRDAGGKLRSKEETIYAHLLGEFKQPWEWWNPYAMASLMGELRINGRSEVHGDIICEDRIILSGSATDKKVRVLTKDLTGFIHANALKDPSREGLTLRNVEIYGYATTTGTIKEGGNVTYVPSVDNPKAGQPYIPNLDEELGSLELLEKEQYEALGIAWFDAGADEITLDWLLDNGAFMVGDTINLSAGIYFSDKAINLGKEDIGGLTIRGYVTFVAPEIHLQGDDNTNFYLNSIEPRGIVLWCTGASLHRDIEISAGDSTFSGVLYVPNGEIYLKGHAPGKPAEYASSPIVASGIDVQGDGWVIWPGAEPE